MSKEIRNPVNLRGGFADRSGLVKENTNFQITSLDDRTRIAFINAYRLAWHLYIAESKTLNGSSARRFIITDILTNVYLKVVDYNTHYSISSVFEMFDETIQKDSYHAVLTLIEYLAVKMEWAAKINDYSYEQGLIFNLFNLTFEKEYVHYRFIDGLIVQITDEVEIDSIEEALNSPHDNVRDHLKKSLSFLSDRESPDYENSIKESISAVEAMCNNIVGKNETLGVALKMLESKGVVIHGALKEAFLKLYGYTSDADGIRHAAGIGGKGATFAEAKYMLVSCSAFVNYLLLMTQP